MKDVKGYVKDVDVFVVIEESLIVLVIFMFFLIRMCMIVE